MKRNIGLMVALVVALVLMAQSGGDAADNGAVGIDLSAGSDTALADLDLSPNLQAIAAEAIELDVVEFAPGSVDAWMASDVLELTLPDGRQLGFAQRAMDPAAAGAEVWSGVGAIGESLTISRMDDIVTVAVQIPGLSLTVSPVDGEHHMLYQDGRDSGLSEERPINAPGMAGNVDPIFASLDDEVIANTSVNGDDVIDVMIAYDSTSTAEFGSDALAEANFVATVDFANVIFANTELDIRLFLVNMTKVNYTSSANDSLELQRLRLTGDGHLDILHTIRNQVDADLVTMVTPIGGCGIAYVLTDFGGNANFGFSVVKPSCMNPGHPAYPHEIGHNLGGAHDPANTNPVNQAYWTGGFGYVDQANGFITIMSYPPANNCCGYLPVFSNNGVVFAGPNANIPTGNANANNRDVFATHAAAVTRYRLGLASAPTNVKAEAGNASAAVSWSAPESDGGGGITGYSVAASPGNQGCSTSGSGRSCTVNGLTNGTNYTFTVKALNGQGTGPGTSVSATPNSVIDPGMSISANSNGKTVIAAIKADGNLYTRTNKNNANEWNGFVKQGAGGWATVDVEITENGKIYLAAVKESGRLYTRIYNGSSWGGWQAHGADTWATDVPPSIAATNSTFTYAAVKQDGRLFTRFKNGASWSAYKQHGANGWFAVDIASDEQGNVWMAGVKDTGRLYTRTKTGSTWGGYTKHGADTWSTDTIPSIEGSSSKVVYAAVKTDGRLYTRQYSDGSWQGYVSHGASGWVGVDIAVTGNNVHLAATKSFGRLYTHGTTGTSWSAWKTHGADTWSTVTDPSIVITQGKPRLIGTKASGALYTRFQSGGSWAGYVSHGNPTWLG